MKILVVNGSPRANGKTASMCNAFRSAAINAGHEVNVVEICKMKIGGCIACEYCHTKGKGKCIQQDDMQMLYPYLKEAEMLVIGSPIYYYGYSGQMQCFLNRIYALDKPAALKKTALFLAAGDPDAFEGAIFAYKGNFLSYLKTEDMGIFTVSGKETTDKVNEQITEMAAKLPMTVETVEAPNT